MEHERRSRLAASRSRTFGVSTEDVNDLIGVEIAEGHGNTVVDGIVLVVAEIDVKHALLVADDVGRFLRQILLSMQT